MTAPVLAASRTQGLGASEVAVLLGFGRLPGAPRWLARQTEWTVYARKMGLPDAPSDNADTDVGRRLEPIVLDLYAERTGCTYVSRGADYLHPFVGPEPWMLATPDGIADGPPHDPERRGVEGKTAISLSGWGPDGSEGVPPWYQAQVCWQMAVLGLDRVDVAVLCRVSLEYRAYTLRRDPATEARIVAHCRAWWERHILGQEPPPVDGSTAAAAWLLSLYPSAGPAVRDAEGEEADLLAELRDVRRQQAALEGREGEIRAHLCQRVGSDRGIVGPAGKALWLDVRGSPRWKAIAEALGPVPADLIAQHSGAPRRDFRFTPTED